MHLDCFTFELLNSLSLFLGQVTSMVGGHSQGRAVCYRSEAGGDWSSLLPRVLEDGLRNQFSLEGNPTLQLAALCVREGGRGIQRWVFKVFFSVGILTCAGMKTSFHAYISPRNRFSCRHRSEC